MKKSKVKPECNLKAYYEKKQKLQAQKVKLGAKYRLEPYIEARVRYGESMWSSDLAAGNLIEFYPKNKRQAESLLNYFDDYVNQHASGRGIDYDVVFLPDGNVADLQVNEVGLLNEFLRELIENQQGKVKLGKTILCQFDEKAQNFVANELAEMKQNYEQSQNEKLDKVI